jgi:hypothetical protein
MGVQAPANFSGNVVLPSASAYPSPFASVPQTLRAVPAAIIDGGAKSDVIITMAGDSASGNKGLAFSSATGDSMVVQTPTIGMILKTSAAAAAYDLLLAVPRKIADDPGDCRVVQAAKTMTAPVVTADASLASRLPLSASWFP